MRQVMQHHALCLRFPLDQARVLKGAQQRPCSCTIIAPCSGQQPLWYVLIIWQQPKHRKLLPVALCYH